MRIMGIDIGDKRIGVAISDELELTAQPLTIIIRDANYSDIQQLKNIVKTYKVKKIIVGLPKNMNGSLGPQSQKVIKYMQRFKRQIDIDYIFWDERLTTVAAEKMLIKADLSRKKRKRVIDKIAAVYILQSYLDSK